MTGMIGSESIAERKTVSSAFRKALRTWMVFGLVSTLITLTACSGGGFNPNNGGGNTPATLAVTVTSVSTVTAGTGDSAVRVNFSVQGDTGQTFSLLFQYFLDANSNGMRDGGESLLNMTEVSMALENILGITSQGDLGSFPAGQNMVSGTFLWQAGADLGFVGTSFGVVITPSSGVAGQAFSAGSTTSAVTYSSGNAPATFMGSIGAGGVVGNGRSGHGAALASDLGSTAGPTDLGNEIVVTGGNNGTADINSIDRFTVDLGARSATASGTFNAANTLFEHAQASYFAGSSIRVLVCGGRNGTGSTNGLATATIYAFGPSGLETAVATGSMTSARRAHAACWLPNNKIFVHGGFNGTGTTINGAELFDPATGTWTALTVPGTVPPRVSHTQTLLPDGKVLIAGGHNGANAALNAFLYDPATDTWTDTGTSVDRVGHSATLLVNGICALIGGSTNAGTALNSATFYRTFADTFNGSTIAAGFTTVSATAMTQARVDHRASRLNDGSVLVTGGLDNGGNTLATAEIFMPSQFTDPAIGFFTQTNPGAVANMDMNDARARHSQTTTGSGSAVVIGGISGTLGMTTTLSTVEVFQFQNAAPSISNLAGAGLTSDVSVTFDLADAEGDLSFVILRFSTDGGTNFNIATLTDYRGAFNLATGTRTIHWNAAADGVSNLSGVTIEVIPVGGAVGAPVRTTL